MYGRLFEATALYEIIVVQMSIATFDINKFFIILFLNKCFHISNLPGAIK